MSELVSPIPSLWNKLNMRSVCTCLSLQGSFCRITLINIVPLSISRGSSGFALGFVLKKKKKERNLEAEELRLQFNAGWSCMSYSVSVGIERREKCKSIAVSVACCCTGPASQAWGAAGIAADLRCGWELRALHLLWGAFVATLLPGVGRHSGTVSSSCCYWQPLCVI